MLYGLYTFRVRVWISFTFPLNVAWTRAYLYFTFLGYVYLLFGAPWLILEQGSGVANKIFSSLANVAGESRVGVSEPRDVPIHVFAFRTSFEMRLI